MSIPSKEDLLKAHPAASNLLDYYDELLAYQQKDLAHQISSLALGSARNLFENSSPLKNSSIPEIISPISLFYYYQKSKTRKEVLDIYWQKGVEAISRGEICCVMVPGSTRLGSAKTTETIPIDFNMIYSQIGLQVSKIANAEEIGGKRNKSDPGLLHWIIMVSPDTKETTTLQISKLAAHFGLDMELITIVCQDEIAAYDENGDFLLSQKDKVATSSNGDGGVYSAISHLLPALRAKGVKFFHIYSIDDVICKPADPMFIGFAISKSVDVATKCVPKQNGDLTSSICLHRGKPRVVNSLELGPDLAEAKSSEGVYLFSAQDTSNYVFTMEFMTRACSSTLRYHRVSAKIPYVNSLGVIEKQRNQNGIVLQKFIADVFEFAHSFYIWEVPRDDVYSPLKNAGSSEDCDSMEEEDLKTAVDKARKEQERLLGYIQLLEKAAGEMKIEVENLKSSNRKLLRDNHALNTKLATPVVASESPKKMKYLIEKIDEIQKSPFSAKSGGRKIASSPDFCNPVGSPGPKTSVQRFSAGRESSSSVSRLPARAAQDDESGKNVEAGSFDARNQCK